MHRLHSLSASQTSALLSVVGVALATMAIAATLIDTSWSFVLIAPILLLAYLAGGLIGAVASRAGEHQGARR